MVIIKEDIKLGTKKRVTFDSAWVGLLKTREISRVKLNYLLLNNEKIIDDRFIYQRQVVK